MANSVLFRWLCVAVAGVWAAVAVGQASSKVELVMAEARKDSPLGQNLRQLTDQVGGRVPGTPAMQKAVGWGEAAFRAAEGENVHSETFQIPVSWAEGRTRFSVETPVSFDVHAVSVAWAPGLNPSRRARIVDVGYGRKQDFEKVGEFAGAILLVHTHVLKTWDDLFEEYDAVPPVLDAAVKGGAALVAFVGARDRDLLYRHTNVQNGRLDRIPQVILAREDGLRIARLIESGSQVYADVAIPNRIGGPFTTANVIAEIRGSEKPDEFVVLGAHLDSWELGTGALDNGCNSAMVIDALRAIRASGVRPRRSIRFILFSGEEEGLLGSWAYTRQHEAELDKAVAAIIFDSGTGRVTGFTLSGRTELSDSTRQLMAPLKPMGVTEVTQDADIGTDNFDFVIEGVPTLEANQEAANYMQNYHAMSDTLDKVDMAQLRNEVVEAATMAFVIADAPQRFGTRQTRAQIEQLLKDTKLDQNMKLVGIWPDWESGKRGRAR